MAILDIFVLKSLSGFIESLNGGIGKALEISTARKVILTAEFSLWSCS